jgi:hypothetical protein
LIVTGAGDKPKYKSQGYDYVFADQIAFIKDTVEGSEKSDEEISLYISVI